MNARPDRGTQRALYTALNGINAAERTVREKIAALRSALDDAEAFLDTPACTPTAPASGTPPPAWAAPAPPATCTGDRPPLS